MMLTKMSGSLEKENAGMNILITFWKDGRKIKISVYNKMTFH